MYTPVTSANFGQYFVRVIADAPSLYGHVGQSTLKVKFTYGGKPADSSTFQLNGKSTSYSSALSGDDVTLTVTSVAFADAGNYTVEGSYDSGKTKILAYTSLTVVGKFSQNWMKITCFFCKIQMLTR